MENETRIGELFRGYRAVLPEPATFFVGLDATLSCEHHGSVAYRRLDALAAEVPIEIDRDIAALLPWCFDPDPCVRQIAVSSLVPRIGYPENALSVPAMHDLEHFQHHDIIFSIVAYLKARGCPFDPSPLEGQLLDVDATQFAGFLHGTWREQDDGQSWLEVVEIDADYVRVTLEVRPPDPDFPDSTDTSRIATIHVDERGRFVVANAWDIQSDTSGYTSGRVIPSQWIYWFWPVRMDLLWFSRGADPALAPKGVAVVGQDRLKLRRVSARP